MQQWPLLWSSLPDLRRRSRLSPLMTGKASKPRRIPAWWHHLDALRAPLLLQTALAARPFAFPTPTLLRSSGAVNGEWRVETTKIWFSGSDLGFHLQGRKRLDFTRARSERRAG